MTWLDALVLRKDEKIVGSWQGTREVVGKTYDVSSKKSEEENRLTVKASKEGLLVLTNQRFVFLEGQEPDFKRIGESVRVSLVDVDEVLFEKAPIEPFEKVEGTETYFFRLKKVGGKKEFNKFKKLLDEYIKKCSEQLG